MDPLFQKPLDHGFHVSMSSCTKYMGGHSDVLMGSLSTNDDDLGARLRWTQVYRGAVPSSFDAYLMHRSLFTFGVS